MLLLLLAHSSMHDHVPLQLFRLVNAVLCSAAACICHRREDKAMSTIYMLFSAAWTGVFLAPYC